MPCNLYGPNDYFDLRNSHVLPALMRKFHEGKLAKDKSVTIWGSGMPHREFLYVDDLARAVAFCMNHYDKEEHLNCGAGEDVSIRDAAHLIKKIVGYDGALEFDYSKPDGTPRKLMNSDKLRALGWRPQTPLEEGLVRTYQWLLEHPAALEHRRAA